MRFGGVDAVLVALVPTAVAAATGDDVVQALARAPGRRAKPIVTVRLEQGLPVELLPAKAGGTVLSYAEPQAAAPRWPTPPTASPGWPAPPGPSPTSTASRRNAPARSSLTT